MLRQCVTDAGGHEVEARADEFFAAFEAPRAAVDAAIATSTPCDAQSWPDDADVRIRIGIHSGYPTSHRRQLRRHRRQHDVADLRRRARRPDRRVGQHPRGRQGVGPRRRALHRPRRAPPARLARAGRRSTRSAPRACEPASRRCGRCSGGVRSAAAAADALLVGARRPQHERIGEHRPDELQPDRQAAPVSPHGIVHAGCWVRLNGYENGVQPSIDSGVIGVCPAGRASNAGTATDGVTSRSKRSMNRRMCEPSSPRRRCSRCTSRLLSREPSSASAAKSGSVTACCSGVSVFHSVHAPVNHSPVVISSGSSNPGSTASTIAPRARPGPRRRRSTAAATSGSTFSA